MNKREKPVRHGDPVRKALCLLFVAVFLAAALIVGINERLGWFPELTWANIYQRTGLGVSPASELPCQVRVLDTGAGDCILVSCEGKHLLIDTGLSVRQEVLTAELARCGVEKLDMLVLTHYHADHTGGLPAILAQFAPEQVLLGIREADDQGEEYQTVHRLCREAGCSVIFAETGMVVELGGLQLAVLSDGSGFSNENDRSLILRGQYGSVSMLFMGDGETTAEKALLNSGAELSAHWLKVGHHGSKTSSSEAFLDAVAPYYAAIPCGSEAEPTMEVLQRLRTREISYARSDLNGAILFSTDGMLCRMDVERGKRIE